MQYQEISVSDAVNKLDNGACLVDIRDSRSFAEGHPPQAQPLNDGNFSDFVENTNKAQAVIVMCYHGISSRGLAQHLSGLGFSEVYSLTGGFADWSLSQAIERDA